MRKIFVVILCVFISAASNLGRAGSNHAPSDASWHSDMEADVGFYMHPPLWLMVFLLNMPPDFHSWASASAPSEADGTYDLYAYVDGGTPDPVKGAYLGGTSRSASSFYPMISISDPLPESHSEHAHIDGYLWIGTNPAEPHHGFHSASNDR